ncbi:Uncharacterised protein [Raoultella terrigena]|uniref:Uncharacterized protein n=1 Tax=Raoultella terrigena TaxID=577 RepID=A0A4U9DB00_RAOTE|nr:Uncharacterised protein [Raoultella terrigena]
MQTTHPTNQHRRIGLQLVDFPRFVGIADGAVDRIAQVNLTVDNFVPVRRQRILKVSHKYFHVGIQGVNHHLAFNGAGDLHPAIL